MIDWEAVVALAQEVDEECANGTPDPLKAARLARAVLTLREEDLFPTLPPLRLIEQIG
jgi:hypothetical protein